MLNIGQKQINKQKQEMLNQVVAQINIKKQEFARQQERARFKQQSIQQMIPKLQIFYNRPITPMTFQNQSHLVLII